MKIKLSDYVIKFLIKKNVKHFFAISGGSSLHLIHSVAKFKKSTYICTHHEQAAAFAADSYSRVSKNIGVAIATSGPGATNLLTGIASSFFDSVPLIVLTGQTSSFRSFPKSKIRQTGFQETNIVDMAKHITKYAARVEKPTDIKFHLEKAFHIATTGRGGPVLIDMPDNFQYAYINTQNLKKKYIPTKMNFKYPNFNEKRKEFFKLLSKSKRPIFLVGWGIYLSKTQKDFINIFEKFNIPICMTWGAADIIPHNHKLNFGVFGTHSNRYSNFAVEKSDLLISFGTRLDSKATGTPTSNFSKKSKKIVIDIDSEELSKFKKFGLKIDILIQDDLKEVVKILKKIKIKPKKNYNDWKNKILNWKSEFEKFDEKTRKIRGLNPYTFFDSLSSMLPKKCNIFVDTGCAVAWCNQAFKLSKGQRLYHDYNNTAMGWSLPASIGSYFYCKENTICIIGDGSLMMALHELSTVKHHKLPIKLIIVNNSGYGMIRQTQDIWMKSVYHASSKEGGVSFPDFKKIANSFDIKYYKVKTIKKAKILFKKHLFSKKAIIFDVIIPKEAKVLPLAKFGRPNTDMEPVLPRKQYKKNILS